MYIITIFSNDDVLPEIAMHQYKDAGSPQPEAQPEPEATPSFEPSREKFLSFLDKVEGKWDNPHFRMPKSVELF